MRKVCIVGATSAIAQSIARNFAAEGAALFLLGRNADHLASVADDLRIRGAAKVEIKATPLVEGVGIKSLLSEVHSSFDGLDIAILAYGSLPSQQECEKNSERLREAIEINFASVVTWAMEIAELFESQKHGTLAVITSVAGDRGRKSNYVYGACKGGVGVFLQGLRNRLHAVGVKVVTIKPGFVDTPMTAHLKTNFLFASADSVGKGAYRAIIKGKNVAYCPGFWRPVMWVIRSIPEGVFKRVSL